MSKSPRQMQSRRQLLTATLRYAMLGLLGATGAFLIGRRSRMTQENKCIGGGVCRGCYALEKCNLPAALSEKQVLAGIHNVGR
jgi:hypothetical protein